MMTHDPRQLQVHRAPAQRDVPYVPTVPPVVAAMLRLAGVDVSDVVYDLGCGDGRIAIAAARLGARAVGIDIDLQRIRECHWNAQKAGLGDRLRFARQSLFDVDFREASVVTLYLLTAINLRLRPKLLWELRPGSRIVSNFFDMDDWRPDKTIETHHRTLHLWTVPAWVAGRWKCVVDAPGGRREHVTLDVHRRFQRVWGTARIGRRDVPVEGATLEGAKLSFSLPRMETIRKPVRFDCRVDGNVLRGTYCCRPGDAEVHAWGGIRAATPVPPPGGR